MVGDQKVHHDSVLIFDVLDRSHMKMSRKVSFVSSEIVSFQGNLASEVKFPILSNCRLTGTRLMS